MKIFLLAVREFMESHQAELAQDRELSAMLKWLVTRLEAQRPAPEKRRKPRVLWF